MGRRPETLRETLMRVIRSDLDKRKNGKGHFGQNAAAREWGIDPGQAHRIFKWLEAGDPSKPSIGMETAERLCAYYKLGLVSAPPVRQINRHRTKIYREPKAV